jgi:hypothetical protein
MAGVVSGVADAMKTENTNARTDRIDDALCKAGALISALLEKGPLNRAQTELIIAAAARKAVPNAEQWELRESATRIAADLERAQK